MKITKKIRSKIFRICQAVCQTDEVEVNVGAKSDGSGSLTANELLWKDSDPDDSISLDDLDGELPLNGLIQLDCVLYLETELRDYCTVVVQSDNGQVTRKP